METQPIGSQDSIFDANELFYSVEEPRESIYALLSILYQPGRCIEIYESKKKYGFGRIRGPDDADIPFKIFTAEEFGRGNKLLSRISQQHFYLSFLERVRTSKGELCAAPIVIQNFGRNGLFVNDHRLKIGEKRILKDGDIIKLVNFELYRFSYKVAMGRNLPSGCPLFNKYLVADVIGRGGCGEVYLCYNIEKNELDEARVEAKSEFKTFALKIIGKNFDQMSRKNNEELMKKLMGEVKIMKDMENTHVLKLINYYESPESLIILVPFMDGGDLLHRILKRENKRLGEFESKFLFLQLLLGLQYMHKKGIGHRDIKCDNILLNHDGEWPLLKISDFGLSKKLEFQQNTICGTMQYCAPEILKKVPYSNKVDVWSSGVVLYAMMSGTMPFSVGRSLEQSIKCGSFEFTNAFNNVSEEAKSIIKLMLQVDVDKRWEVNALLRHSWLRDTSVNIRLLEVYAENSCEDDDFHEEILMKEIRDIIIDDDEPCQQQAKRLRLC